MTTVTVSDGVLKGSEADGVYSFKGIPYAAAISGENRWLPPKAPEPWSGERDATSFGNICPQQDPPTRWLVGKAGRLFIDTFWKDEPAGDDCLNLNVWTPTIDPEAKLPVMYYIHGGSFTTGSGSLNVYDGSNSSRSRPPGFVLDPWVENEACHGVAEGEAGLFGFRRAGRELRPGKPTTHFHPTTK